MTEYASPVVPRRSTRPAAWWGMVILIASESTLFGLAALAGWHWHEPEEDVE